MKRRYKPAEVPLSFFRWIEWVHADVRRSWRHSHPGLSDREIDELIRRSDDECDAIDRRMIPWLRRKRRQELKIILRYLPSESRVWLLRDKPPGPTPGDRYGRAYFEDPFFYDRHIKRELQPWIKKSLRREVARLRKSWPRSNRVSLRSGRSAAAKP